MDGLLRVGRNPCRSTSSTSGCAAGSGRYAGRSGNAHERASGGSARSVSAPDARHGRIAEGILAHRRAPGLSNAPCRTPTGTRAGPKGIRSTPTTVPGCHANRRVRTRMPGGVGGAGASRPLPDSVRGGGPRRSGPCPDPTEERALQAPADYWKTELRACSWVANVRRRSRSFSSEAKKFPSPRCRGGCLCGCWTA